MQWKQQKYAGKRLKYTSILSRMQQKTRKARETNVWKKSSTELGRKCAKRKTAINERKAAINQTTIYEIKYANELTEKYAKNLQGSKKVMFKRSYEVHKKNTKIYQATTKECMKKVPRNWAKTNKNGSNNIGKCRQQVLRIKLERNQ